MPAGPDCQGCQCPGERMPLRFPEYLPSGLRTSVDGRRRSRAVGQTRDLQALPPWKKRKLFVPTETGRSFSTGLPPLSSSTPGPRELLIRGRAVRGR